MPVCQCEGCRNQLQRALDFGRIFEELERPNLLEQLTSFYQNILEVDALSFGIALYHANESPDLTQGQRIKLFHYYYKPLKINLLDMGQPVKEKAKIDGGIQLW